MWHCAVKSRTEEMMHRRAVPTSELDPIVAIEGAVQDGPD